MHKNDLNFFKHILKITPKMQNHMRFGAIIKHCNRPDIYATYSVTTSCEETRFTNLCAWLSEIDLQFHVYPEAIFGSRLHGIGHALVGPGRF